MKLYYHPVSTASRPVVLFAADNGIALDFQVVDILKGEHMGDAYSAINPSHLVPVLEDGDFRLTESSAILKYLADKTDSPAYPKDLKKRARVNEMMDWFNTKLLPRLRLRPRLSAALPAPQAAHRRGARRHDTVGQGQGRSSGSGCSTSTCWDRARSTCAATRSRSPTTSARA